MFFVVSLFYFKPLQKDSKFVKISDKFFIFGFLGTDSFGRLFDNQFFQSMALNIL